MSKNTFVAITGKTYPVREKLKSLGAKWNAENKCWMIAADKAGEARAIVNGQPALNNPIAVPVDQGPVDVTAVCAKYGRNPIADKTTPFRKPSAKGAPSRLGEVFWGRSHGVRSRFLVIQEGRPFYLSATALEDNDDFNTRPGWYCHCECVAVDPLDSEIAEDNAIKQAKTDKENATNRRREITRIVQGSPQSTDPRAANVSTSGMTKVWGEFRMAGSEAMYTDGQKLVYVTSDYDMGPACWELADVTLAAEALSLKTDSKI